VKSFFVCLFFSSLAGCASRYDFAPQRADAGLSPVVNSDSGEPMLPDADGGVRMPPLADAGSPLGDVPSVGSNCDPDREHESYDCAREGCDRAYLVCLRDARWSCVPDVGAVCRPVTNETDAGVRAPPLADAGSPDIERDAGPVVGDCVPGTTDSCVLDCGVEGVRFCLASATYDTVCRETAAHRCPAPEHDAGPQPIVEHDAGTTVDTVDAGPACEAGSFVGCWLTCLGYDWPGHIDCDPGVGYFGSCQEFVGLECSSIFGTDAGTPPIVEHDAGTDSGTPPVVDAGTDTGTIEHDAGSPVVDAGTDSGPLPAETRTIEILFAVDTSVLQSTSSMDLLEEMAAMGATHAHAQPATCDVVGIVTEGVRQFFRCRMTRPVGAELFFTGRFHARASSIDGWSEGQTLATMSGWGRRDCGPDAATAHVLWVIRDSVGRTLLNPDGLPDIVQPRGITEDGYPVCRGRVVFASSLP
jgi:hypothetical protein